MSTGKYSWAFFHKLLLEAHEEEWIWMRTGSEDKLQQDDGKRNSLYHRGEGEGGRKLLVPGSHASTVRNLLPLVKAW